MKNTGRLSIVSCAVAGLLLSAGPVRGDVLELKNGNVLNGRYVGGSAGTIRFETSEGVKVVETGEAIALTFTTAAPAAPPAAAPAAMAVPPVAPPPVAPPTVKAVTVPAGTPLLVRMMDSISSENKAGTRFTTTLETNIVIDGVVALKAGTKIYGTLQSAAKARRAVGKASIDIRLAEIATAEGTQLIATSNYQEAGKGSGGKTLGAAAVGAGIGAVVDGGDGAGKGAAIGAGVSLLKKGETVTVPPNMLLEFQLTRALSVNVPQP